MRSEILQGELPYPGSKIFEQFPDQEKDILAFWSAIWLNFLRRQETNGIHWYDRLGCKLYNRIVRAGCEHGWLISNSLPGRKWASVELDEDKLLEFVSADELLEVRKAYKYKKYLLGCEEARASTLVRQNGDTKRTGLRRPGFRDAGNTQFGYDMAKLQQYEEAVKHNLIKSMEKLHDERPNMQSEEDGYDKIAVGIYDWHLANASEVYTTGENLNDSRGRAISQSLKRVMNPISSKDARAALVITYED